MCHTLVHVHIHCRHIQNMETIPCVTSPALGRCISNSVLETRAVEGDILYCTSCFDRADVQLWIAIAEAEFQRQVEKKYWSEVRVRQEVRAFREDLVGRLVRFKGQS